MFDALYFSLLVLAVAGVGVIIQPNSGFAKVLLIANICIVSMNVAVLQGKVKDLQEKVEETKSIL